MLKEDPNPRSDLGHWGIGAFPRRNKGNLTLLAVTEYWTSGQRTFDQRYGGIIHALPEFPRECATAVPPSPKSSRRCPGPSAEDRGYSCAYHFLVHPHLTKKIEPSPGADGFGA
jgi:hypothetical protein